MLILHRQVRLLNAFRFVLRSERSRTPITPAQLFQPLITESHGSLMELDYNIHSEFDEVETACMSQFLMNQKNPTAHIFKMSTSPELISYAHCFREALNKQEKAKAKVL